MLSVAVLVLVAGVRDAAASRIAVPSYFYPDCDWNPACHWRELESSTPAVGMVLINPGVYTLADPRVDPGPRTRYDNEHYRQQVVSTRSRGILVLAYVPTHYAARDLFLVKDDIDLIYDRFAPDGVFLDEAPNMRCVAQSYFAELYAYIKGKGGPGVVVLNPGATTQECYMSVADVIVNFEGTYASYQSWAPAGWERAYPPQRFWHLVYDTPTVAMMIDAVQRSRARNADWIYVTPDVMPNPWNTLPPAAYWSQEQSVVLSP